MSKSKKVESSAMWQSYEARFGKESPEEVEIYNSNNEFSPAVQELIDRGVNAGLDRKKFLTIMGASLSMAGLNCVKDPLEKIVPYVDRPADFIPGVPVYYATGRAGAAGYTPLLVKTREGKPIKIEGLDEHPYSRGAVDGDTIATIWDLYDPDRIKSALKRNGKEFKEIKWDAAFKDISAKMGGKVRVVSGVNYSPAERAAISDFLKNGDRKQVVLDAGYDQGEVLAGNMASYGAAYLPQYRFDKADLIVSLGADFLGSWLSSATYTKQFSSRRNPDENMTRLIAAETMMSVTGGAADTRFAINAGTELSLALGIIKQLLPGSKFAGDAAVNKATAAFTAEKTAEITGISAEAVKQIADELKKNRGNSLVVGGGIGSRYSSQGAMQIAVNLINEILGNTGNTVMATDAMLTGVSVSSDSEIAGLVKELESGSVDVLILDRSNPFFEMPEASGFAKAAAKAKMIVSISEKLDESAKMAHYVLGSSHYLESWSDALSNGYYSISQPVIQNLFDTKSPGDIWMSLAGKKDFYSYLQNAAKKYLKGDFQTAWDKTLSDGYVRSATNTNARGFNAGALASITAVDKPMQGYRLSLYKNVGINDGKGGNNAYRHELPDPVTKVTWDNYIAVSVADAKAKDWVTGDVLKIKAADRSITAPVFVQPGLPKGSMALAIGYGHESIGKVGNGVGVNAMKLAGFSASGPQFGGIAVTVEKVDSGYTIATTQRHHSMEGRHLARIAKHEDYTTNKKSGNEFEKLPGKGLYPDLKKTAGYFNKHHWGLNIDLNKCTGCSACVVSCYSENNIPAVGKDEVAVGREMSWLRIDRYYGYITRQDEKADKDMVNPVVHHQPVMCQHCDNAPCENVCPVGATSQSTEGLNDMAYNRCIGTRYCANNCPYKVRRFNWFENWEGKLADPEQLALNPDVTVRSRGVIEKCSMCVHRIAEARQQASVEGREIKDGEIQTACQQACPADAITFGDKNDSKSKVIAKNNDPRSYRILEEINVEPAVTYMVKINKQS